MTFPVFPDETKVYRAIGFANYINKQGEIKWQAYKPLTKDTAGVSVAFTPEHADDLMGLPIFGITELIVGMIRNIKCENITLDVIQDTIDHAEIRNIPYPYNFTGIERVKIDAVVRELCEMIQKIAKKIDYTPKAKLPP